VAQHFWVQSHERLSNRRVSNESILRKRIVKVGFMRFQNNTFLVVLGFAFLVMSCGQSGQNSSPVPKYMEEMAKNDNGSLFSFMFFNPPPEGIGLKGMLHDVQTADACSFFGNESEDGDSNFQYIKFELNKVESGTYNIKNDVRLEAEDLNADQNIAAVSFVDVQDWKTANSIYASGGKVVLESSPKTIDELEAGKDLKLTISANFPDALPKVLSTLECTSGTGMGSVCQCELASKEIRECESELQNYDCCKDEYESGSENTLNVDFEISAGQCPYLCSATNRDFYDLYCTQLF
jgi:hypothetical protein